MVVTRVALAGLGAVSEAHLAAYENLESVHIVAGADPSAERRQWAEETYGLKTYSDVAEMLAAETPELVSVLTPAATHRRVAEAAMAAGAHVLCEKPLAVTLDDAIAMGAASKKHGVRFFYGSTYRFLPAIIAARKLIAAGGIGRVKLMTEDVVGGSGIDSWHPYGFSHYPEGGPGGGGMGLVDHGIHLIDAFGWLSGGKVVSVFGQGNISGAAPGVEYAVLDFDNGAIGRLTYNEVSFSAKLPAEGTISWGAGWNIDGSLQSPGQWTPEPGEILVYGENGALRIQHYANHLFLFDKDGPRKIPLEGKPVPGNFTLQLTTAIEDIRVGRKESVGIEQGIDALRVLLAIYESQRSGRKTNI